MAVEEQKAHSPIGASTCERWWNCPGSVKLIEALPPQQDTTYSATGTVAHTLGEKVLKGVFNPLQLWDEIGRSYVQGDFEIEVTEEMVLAVEVYRDTICNALENYTLDPLIDLKVEQKFALTHIDPEAYGTCDAVINVPFNKLIVIDYKHGQGHAVEVENNKQLLYYALGAYYDLPSDERENLASVEMVVVQPRAKHKQGMVRRSNLLVKGLLEHERDLRTAIERVRTGDPTLATGTHCKFCPAKPICPAIRDDIQRTAELDFTNFEVEKISLPVPSSLTPERLAHLITNASLFKEWAASIIAYGHRLAENGQSIPGYKLVEKRANRRWVNPSDVEGAFGLEFGEDVYNKKLKSPAQMEKLLGKRKSELEDYWETPIAGKTLVALGDLRDGVPPDAVSDFDEWVT